MAFLAIPKEVDIGFSLPSLRLVFVGLSYFVWAGAGFSILFAVVVVAVFLLGAGVLILFAEVVKAMFQLGVGVVMAWAEVGTPYLLDLRS